MDSEAKLLKFPPAGDSTGNSTPSHASSTSTAEPPSAAANKTSAKETSTANEPPPPIWVQRFLLITTVIICLWIGLVLAVLPWLPPWTENAIINDFPNLRWLLGTGFVRGLVTGLGLLDLWIGISEAVHYRDRR